MFDESPVTLAFFRCLATQVDGGRCEDREGLHIIWCY